MDPDSSVPLKMVVMENQQLCLLVILDLEQNNIPSDNSLNNVAQLRMLELQ